MRLPRLRRGPRPRSADDDDWGTSSPAAIMESPVPAPLPAKASAFSLLKQQDLKSYTCTFSPRCVVSLYFAIALLFIPIGSAIIAGTRQIRTFGKIEYTDRTRYGDCHVASGEKPTTCIIEMKINQTIPAPSYLYYSLTNFFQNSRKYAKSRSDVMNLGIVPSKQFDVQNCEAFLFENPDTGGRDGFDPTEFIYPCGLTARSRFNDTFKLCHDDSCDEFVRTSSEGIAWKTDKDHKFNPGDDRLFNRTSNKLFNLTANELLKSEDFMVWMRLSAFPNFDKLYRIIEEDLIANETYYMHIEANFPVEGFSGTKAFHISTVQWFGAQNPFLGTAYLVVGVTALFIAIILLVKHVINPRTPTITDPAMLLREKMEAISERPQHVIPPQ